MLTISLISNPSLAITLISKSTPDDYLKIVKKYHLLMGETAALNRVDQISDVFSISSVSKK